MPAFYAFVRGLFGVAVRLFFRLEAVVDPARALGTPGPVIFVGNHPNGLVDPALVFVLAQRHVTFLAKEPLFRMPVLGALIKALGALPVFRKKDGADTAKNDGTLTAAAQALVQGRAITIFPEGKSHSEPMLQELKTGCARIALMAARQGAAVHVVPLGFTYEAKNRFRSKVRVEVGSVLAVQGAGEFEEDREQVSALTDRIAQALSAITLNLEAWEDLPIVETAEALYALAKGEAEGDPERLRAFARGLPLVRDAEPERFELLKQQVASFGRRLALVEVRPADLHVRYRIATVARFILRNAMWLLGLPIVALGFVAFFVPYWTPLLLARVSRAEADTESTVKLLAAMLVAPLWWAGSVAAAWLGLGPWAALVTFVAVPVVSLFTRYFLERRHAAFLDARAFLVLGSRRRLKARLREEGLLLGTQIDALVSRYRAKVAA